MYSFTTVRLGVQIHLQICMIAHIRKFRIIIEVNDLFEFLKWRF